MARNLRAIYVDGNRTAPLVPLNTEKFAQLISEHYNITIHSQTCQELGTHCKGLLARRKDNTAIILIAENNNECWRRFVYIKELCHLFLAERDISCNDAPALAEELLDQGQDERRELFSSEAAAAFAAIEIMIPDSIHDKIAHMSNVEGKTPYQIAYFLKTPKKHVEMRMREWGIPINSETPK